MGWDLMVTSAFEAWVHSREPYGGAIHQEALQHDWAIGKPVALKPDPDGQWGGGVSLDGKYVGYLPLVDPQGRDLMDFRWVRKNGNPTWAHVFAKQQDGRIWYVGKLRRATARQVREL